MAITAIEPATFTLLAQRSNHHLQFLVLCAFEMHRTPRPSVRPSVRLISLLLPHSLFSHSRCACVCAWVRVSLSMCDRSTTCSSVRQ